MAPGATWLDHRAVVWACTIGLGAVPNGGASDATCRDSLRDGLKYFMANAIEDE